MCCWKKVLLLSHQHGGLRFLLGEEAVRSLARIDGQARDLLVELAARLSNVLAKIFEQHHGQILDHKVELVHVPNVFVIRTITGIESIGLKAQHMIQHLQNWGEVLVHLGQNLLLCHLFLRVEGLLGLRKRARLGGQAQISKPSLKDLTAR